MLVPAARFTIQVKGLVVRAELTVSIARADTIPPGRAALHWTDRQRDSNEVGVTSEARFRNGG